MSVSRTWKSSWVAVALVVILVAGSFVVLVGVASGAFGSSTDSQSVFARRLAIEGLHGPVDVGAPLGFQLEVLDNKGDIFRSYKGTVEFWSSDPEAVVPSSYTFVRSDSGQHVFPVGSLVFNSPGNQTLTVLDVKKTELSGTIEVYVEQPNTPPSGDWSSPVSIGIGSSSELNREVTIESNSLGYAAVAWSGAYENGKWGVFANRYGPGVGWTGAEYLGLAQFPSYVCVGIDERGDITVAWVNDETICSIRYTLADNLWGAVVVVSNVANSPRGLTMAVESHGMAVMAWQADEGATKGIYASTRRIGNVWSAPVLIESKTGYARDPDAAITGGGDAFVAFSVTNGSFENVCVNRYFAISNYWLGEITLYDRAYYSYLPKVSMDLYGNAFVAWDYCDGYAYMPYASVFRKGFGWGGPVRLDSATSSVVSYPDVSAYGNCNAVVSWTIVSSDSRNIRTNRYVNGSTWLGPVTIASGLGNSFTTSVSADSSGSSYVVWCQNDGSSNASGYRMNACVYNNSIGWSTPSIVAWVGNTSGFAVAAGPSDTAIMVWDEYGPVTDVWASTYGIHLLADQATSNPADN